MLERLINDWLTKVTERQFEFPFGQLLLLKGHKVIHHARPHGPMEQGKDLISLIGPDVHAYQLKQGNLTLKEWREGGIKGQVEDMLDTQIQHPSVPHGKQHKSHLVTTGLLDDTLRQTIDQFNLTRVSRNQPTLDVITGGDIKAQILSQYEEFIPIDPLLFKGFLGLITSNKSALPDKEKLMEFLCRVGENFTHGGQGKSNANLERLGGHLWLITSHISHHFESKLNWIAAIEVWVTSTAALFHAESRIPQYRIDSSALDVPLLKISDLMVGFLEEIKIRDDLHADDFGMEDAFLVQARISACIGWCTASMLFLKSRGVIDESYIREIFDALKKWIPSMRYWGESACPHYLSIIWFLHHYGAHSESERLLFRLLFSLLQAASFARSKDPETQTPFFDPYVGVEEALIASIPDTIGQKKDIFTETQETFSYYLEAIVALIAKRLWRQSLASKWSQISEITLCEFRWTKDEDFWTWRATKGREASWEWSQPTSWDELLKKSRSINTEKLPHRYGSLGAFHLLHLLVFPHRLNTDIILSLDEMNRSGWT